MKDFPGHWAVLLKCMRCRDGFLSFSDIRNLYPPLIPLRHRRAEKVLCHIAGPDLDAAFARIERIDSQSILIVAFEAALVSLHKAPGSE